MRGRARKWRHLPEEYGKWNSVFRRYRRWATTGVFDAMLKTLASAVETRWPGRHDRQHGRPGTLLCRGHKKGTGATEALGRSRGGFTTKLHARCDIRGRPLAFVLTPGQAHDTQGFGPLMHMIADRIDALLADKGYDSDAVRDTLISMDVEAVIPARRNRRSPAAHDRVKYRWRNQIERLFNKLKNWLSCPLLSGPSTMTVWTREGTTNAFEEAQAGGDHRKLREVEIVLGQGGTTAEACRRIAVSEQTYYRWRKEYGGLKTDQARRMKDLEKENARLRRAISDLTLDKLILQEAARGNF